MLASSSKVDRIRQRNLVSSFGGTMAAAFAAVLLLSSALSPAFADSFFVSTASNGKAVYSDDDGATWTISNHNHKSMSAVGYAEGTWVALGEEGGTGQALHSDDGGQTWNVATTPPSGTMLGVTFANGRFVAVGIGGAAAYSDDLGQTWVSSFHSNGNMRGVTFGNGRFVAVGLGGVASYSLDGINWVTANHDNGQMTSVAFGNATFVAVDGGGGSPTGDHVSFSTDGGQTWSNNIVEPLGNLRSVTFANGRFVGVGSDGKYRYSDDDGVTWIDGVFDDGGTPSTSKTVAHGNGRFVAIGDSTGAYSFDGITWFRSAPHNNTSFQPSSNALAHGETIDNEAPVAKAGPDQAARAGDTVLLDGSGSFDDNTPTASLGYAWNFTSKPVTSLAVIANANTVSPSFTFDVTGSYTIELIVSDEAGLTSVADAVKVSADNLAPTADAGIDQLAIVGDLVSLEGSDSMDPEGDTLAFDWEITSAPAGSTATLANPLDEFPSFVPDLAGAYWVSLTVSDLLGPGTIDMVLITVSTAEDFASMEIVLASELVLMLDPGAGEITTEGNRTAFLNFLGQALAAIQTGDLAGAIDKLEKVLARTDGCVLGSGPDGNGPGRDWITDCTAQTSVYDCLVAAIDALSGP